MYVILFFNIVWFSNYWQLLYFSKKKIFWLQANPRTLVMISLLKVNFFQFLSLKIHSIYIRYLYLFIHLYLFSIIQYLVLYNIT